MPDSDAGRARDRLRRSSSSFTFRGRADADPDNLRNRVWEPAVKAAGLRHVVMHSLRHTYASLLIQQGENPKYISEQMGHSSIQITMDRYGHLFPNQKRTTGARLEAQLAAGKEPPLSRAISLASERSD
jgi:integrase